MNNCRTRGLVLRVSDHGESDKIVTLYSPDLGKATAIAKGAKRSKKRFSNKLEEFTLLQIHYNTPKRDSLLFLREADLEDSFLSLRQVYDRFVAASFIGELTLRFTREHDPDPPLFSLLTWALEGLDKGSAPLQTCALFLLRILSATGYQPVLERCGYCGETVRSGCSYSLHTGGGSLVCDSCRNTVRGNTSTISVQTLKFLQHAQRIDQENLERLRMTPKNVHESLEILHKYALHLLQHEIHCWKLLKSMRS